MDHTTCEVQRRGDRWVIVYLPTGQLVAPWREVRHPDLGPTRYCAAYFDRRCDALRALDLEAAASAVPT